LEAGEVRGLQKEATVDPGGGSNAGTTLKRKRGCSKEKELFP